MLCQFYKTLPLKDYHMESGTYTAVTIQSLSARKLRQSIRRHCSWLGLLLLSSLLILVCVHLKLSRYADMHMDSDTYLSCRFEQCSSHHERQCCDMSDNMATDCLLAQAHLTFARGPHVGCKHLQQLHGCVAQSHDCMGQCWLIVLLQVKIQTSPGFAKGLLDGMPKFVEQNGIFG